MATTFVIQLVWGDQTYRYHCEMLGVHYHVSGKNKSILISHEGKLLAGEINPEFIPPIFAAIQRQVSPTNSAKIISIRRPTSGGE